MASVKHSICVIRMVMAWNCIGTDRKKNGRERRMAASRCIHDHWIWIHYWRRQNRSERWRSQKQQQIGKGIDHPQNYAEGCYHKTKKPKDQVASPSH